MREQAGRVALVKEAERSCGGNAYGDVGVAHRSDETRHQLEERGTADVVILKLLRHVFRQELDAGDDASQL